MNARPILFRDEMVDKLLMDWKTQTRRAIKPQPRTDATHGDIEQSEKYPGEFFQWVDGGDKLPSFTCPYGVPGDLLWVRETWHTDTLPLEQARAEHEDMMSESPIYFRASVEELEAGYLWRPSIHLPRWASRLTLRITDIRVQRVQEITEYECEEEGVGHVMPHSAREMYAKLWDSINGKGAWRRNPWVWALTFEVIEKNVDDVLRAAA